MHKALLLMNEGEEENALTQTLLECARQLEAFCEQLGVDADDVIGWVGSDDDDEEPRQGQELDEEEELATTCSAVRMVEECMEMLASMESTSLDECGDDLDETADAADREQGERSESVVLKTNSVLSESADARAAFQTDVGPLVRRALLDEMNALSDELGAFMSLMLESTECSSICGEESSLGRTNEEEEGRAQSHGDPPGVAVVQLPVRNLQVGIAATAQPPVLEPAPLAQPDQPLSQIAGQNPPSLPREQSNYQKILRANPLKPNRATRFRANAKERGRPKQQQQLHSKVREILSSPTLWKEFQTKSFQQHIKRQQQARYLAEQESLEAEQASAAHFKRAQYALKLSRACSERQVAGVRSSQAVQHDASYLRRFRTDRRRLLQSPQEVERQHAGPVSCPQGLLCGVYVYGKRQLGLAYFTCTSLVQLEERVCLRFGISSILNMYRERVAAAKSTETRVRSSQKQPNRIRTFQRITSFNQVQDGDCICATQDSYEDMAILCEWIKQRQHQIYHMQPAPPPKPAPSSGTVQTPSAHISKVSQRSTRGPGFAASTAQTEENASLWDANGRCMAVKKHLIV